MKYLLILLFFFSIHSFSDELGNTGLTCYKNDETDLKKYSAYYFKKNKKVKVYKLKKIKDEIKIKYLNDLKYSYDIGYIKIFTNYSFYKINRNTLEIISDKGNKCKPHNSLKEVFKQMNIYARNENKKLFKGKSNK